MQLKMVTAKTKLSREKAVRHESWIELEKAYEEKATVIGLINGKVKGGFTVELNGVTCILTRFIS